MGIRAYLPSSDLSQRTKFYPAERFHYEAEHDHYLCPQGQTLRLAIRRQSEQVFIYAGAAAVCNACPVKAECTESQSGRHIFRSFFQDYLDRVEAYRKTEAYQKALRKRSDDLRDWPWQRHGSQSFHLFEVGDVEYGQL